VRDANVWRTVQLQLNAIEAYSVNLPREDAGLLRLVLGLAVFSGPRLYARSGRLAREATPERPDGEDALGLEGIKDILGTLRELTEVLRKARGI
jgi:hypothetical protein